MQMQSNFTTKSIITACDNDTRWVQSLSSFCTATPCTYYKSPKEKDHQKTQAVVTQFVGGCGHNLFVCIVFIVVLAQCTWEGTDWRYGRTCFGLWGWLFVRSTNWQPLVVWRWINQSQLRGWKESEAAMPNATCIPGIARFLRHVRNSTQ